MITENLSTLKIHKLTQAQYDRELAAGNIDENALYLTPDEEIDLSPYATVEQLNTVSDSLTDVVYAEEDSVESATAPLNADTLGGRLPNEYALTEDVETAISSHSHTVDNITDLIVTAKELNYLDGVTSKVQNQLNLKAGIYSPVFQNDMSLGRKADTDILMYSVALGKDVEASGYASHAEGYETEASGYYSHAEGYQTHATNPQSHAEGKNTWAKGSQSHAEGLDTWAYAQSSHAEGIGTTACSTGQHVQGKYNISDYSGTYAHIVGNGTDSVDGSACSNAHTLDWSGNAWYAGDVYVGGTSQADATALGAAISKLSNPYPDWSHLKWYVMGDSLTDRNANHTEKYYYDFVQEKTGIQVIVDGIGGTGYGAGVSTSQSYYDRVQNIPDDVDIVTIFGSGNDIRFAESANAEIWNTLSWLALNKPTLRVIVVPPSPWKDYNKREDPWKAYCDRLQVCALACNFRYVSDMYDCPPFYPSFTGHMENFFTTDTEGIHPDENGHKALAPYFYNALLQELALKL